MRSPEMAGRSTSPSSSKRQSEAELPASAARSPKSAVRGTPDNRFRDFSAHQRRVLAGARPRQLNRQWLVRPQSCPSSAKTGGARRTAAYGCAVLLNVGFREKSPPTGFGRGPTSPTCFPMAGAPRKLSVIRENWRRQANGRLRVWSPAQRRLWGKLATDRFWPVAALLGRCRKADLRRSPISQGLLSARMAKRG
jgi:hypothetical protein